MITYLIRLDLSSASADTDWPCNGGDDIFSGILFEELIRVEFVVLCYGRGMSNECFVSHQIDILGGTYQRERVWRARPSQKGHGGN